MGLFTKTTSPLDGMSDEAKKLAEKLSTSKGGTATLEPPKGSAAPAKLASSAKAP